MSILIETIPHLDFPIKSLNFSGIFYKKIFHQYLFQLDLSNISKTLIELDLSFCNLTDDEIGELLIKQFIMKNLKKLNLSSNKLTDNIFESLISNNSHEIYKELKELDLSI